MLTVEVDDRATLDALINQVEYRDDYVGGGVDPAGTRHGPYWLDRLSPDVYEPVTGQNVVEIVREWLAECGTVPRELEDTIQRQVFDSVMGSANSYVLRDLDKSAINDYGDVHTEFHEIVVIDRTAQKVRLIVASDD
ncbi:hypothetical protein ACQPW1_14245 [Nocardia sp. CA-128927]|uniref:hypothetical protein n=1 Tax=Nocardia sp. CA-128927 TaxID=3239975 RepID=UPI003D96D4AD